jgi:hypothetical protein
MARVLTLDDVRWNPSSWRFTASPLWAYSRFQYTRRYHEAIPEVWAGVVAELQALAEAAYEAALEARFARRAEWKRRIDEGTASDAMKSVFEAAHLFEREMPTVHAPLCPNKQLLCRECGEMFFATWPTRRCSRRCLRAYLRRRQQLRRPSRAKVHDDLRCGHCGGTFTPTRSDARYCSLRCRVAAHRARGQS